YYKEKADSLPEGAERTEHERRATLLAGLASNPEFAASVVVEMASYDPREERHSPYRVLSKILDKKLTRVLGGGPGPRRPKPTDLGRELMRILRLSPEDSSRKRLEWCVLKLSQEERDLIWLRYRDDMKHEAVQKQKRWSDRKIDEVRKSAVSKLLTCM